MSMRNSIIATALLFLTTLCALAYNVELLWNPSLSPNVTNYNIFYGGQSGIYTNETSVGNVTNCVISNLTANVYYFSATAVNTQGMSSQFSAQAVYTNNPTGTTNPPVTYVGIQLNYGTNLTAINFQEFQVLAITNDPGYFYSQQLVLTNNPLVGTTPHDGNSYLYVDAIITYGLNLTSLTNVEQSLTTFTNPPSNQFYSEQLVITNNPF
jgi:hypothetical protein